MNPDGERLRAGKLAVVRALLDALDARDIVAIGRLLTDDVVYHFPGRGSLAGTYRGREAVLHLFRTIAQLFDEPPAMRRHDLVASEAHVVDLATYSGRRSDQRFEWSVVRLYHVDADRISEVWLMIGDVYAFDAWLG